MFLCSGCGICCQHLDKNSIYASFHDGNGICRHYDEISQRCLIYDTRPLLCRIDDIYPVLFADKLSLEEYYRLVKKSCFSLQTLPKIRG
jgi:hypothetical protein